LFLYQGTVADGSSVLVIGAGPCGLRTAIETQMMGAQTVIIERRDDFTRNNVLKLWKFLLEDLKSLGAKKLFGMFCVGNINHVGIKNLQLILSKVSVDYR
jgi:2-polyprenyl-6-methoxyphenol hydroxylase-like FAD-dependent oxidoreductase